MRDLAMSDLFEPKNLAILFGLLGLACQLGWPLFQDKQKMLIVQLGIGSFYAAHYALLGASSGAALCTLGALQTLSVLLFRDRKASLLFPPLVVLLCALTWSGLPSALALTAPVATIFLAMSLFETGMVSTGTLTCPRLEAPPAGSL